MNGIKYIYPDSEALTLKSLALVVYTFYVSEIKIVEDTIISAYQHADIYDYLKFPEDSIDSSIAEIQAKGIMSIKKGVVYLGTAEGKLKTLFKGKKLDTSKEFKQLLKFAETYYQDASSKVTKNQALTCKSKISSLQDKSPYDYKIFDFAGLFAAGYETIYQAPYREFTQKEWGQVKKFVDLYDKPMALKMLLGYILYYEKFTNTLSVGNLLYYKDEINSLINKSTTKTTYDEEGGF